MNRSMGLGHVLRMPIIRRPRYALFSEVGIVSKKV